VRSSRGGLVGSSP
jgi:hypothetical protein